MTTLTKEDSIRHHAWAKLRIQGVSKTFASLDGGAYRALGEVDIDITRGDFYCLLGPSGCGKSTILNLVAGFDKPTSGVLLIEGAEVPKWASVISGPSTDRTMVFQDVSAALFPWLNVEENVLFGPKLAGHTAAECRDKLTYYLSMVGLTDHARKFPFELSGGMKQRVQIARALIMEPEILLMDEPFAALDAITKRGLQRELVRIWEETGTTILYVTHDITEALLLATRTAVMTRGPGAGIRKEVAVSLARPRDPNSAEFGAAARALETLLEEENSVAGSIDAA